jgi:ABC-type branched-subunit amino acid transport system ATPase component
MTAATKLRHKQIYLFEDHSDHKIQNSLKEFIYYLRFNDKKGIIDFSYASAEESIHPELSIKDNFILDAIPTSLIKNKEDNLRQRISELNNKVLIELINELDSIERKSGELTREELKLCSIVKSLLSSSEYIFLERPDQDLQFSSLKKIKQCILYEVENNKRSVFIRANDNNCWLDIATDIISKDDKKNYVRNKNPLNSQNRSKKQKETFTPTYDFTLIKKAS